ncbi:hypothetical protein FRC11_009619, partial [Ceratobasidium sp. 423]
MDSIGFITQPAKWNKTEVSSDTTLAKFVQDKINDESRDPAQQGITAVGKPENESALKVLTSAARGEGFAFLTGYSTADTSGNETINLYGFFGGTSNLKDNFLESDLKEGDSITY